MTLIFTLIFLFSLCAGFAYGWLQDGFGIRMMASMFVGGFFGTGIIALLFTYFYFLHKETDTEKIKRLKDEIRTIKSEKPRQ